MTLHDWPATDRPRERLHAQGPDALSDAELLALFLGTGPRGSNAVAHAQGLINRCGGLRALLDRAPAELRQLPGIGPARAALISGALALGRRQLQGQLARGDALASPRQAGEYFSRWLRASPRERFGVLFLDNRHRVIAHEVLFEGSIDSAAVLGHNHPSGVAEPSAADRQLTTALKQALALVEVRLLDHFVVGDGPAVSMAERGWV
jgi:DNA repair protein RadC